MCRKFSSLELAENGRNRGSELHLLTPQSELSELTLCKTLPIRHSGRSQAPVPELPLPVTIHGAPGVGKDQISCSNSAQQAAIMRLTVDNQRRPAWSADARPFVSSRCLSKLFKPVKRFHLFMLMFSLLVSLRAPRSRA